MTSKSVLEMCAKMAALIFSSFTLPLNFMRRRRRPILAKRHTTVLQLNQPVEPATVKLFPRCDPPFIVGLAESRRVVLCLLQALAPNSAALTMSVHVPWL